MLSYNRRLLNFSRKFRKNMTDAERHLWSKIRIRQVGGYQFYRQRIIGDYIVDFYCPRAKLVIEVDGGQHNSDKAAANDEERSEYLNDKGLTVIRFDDIEVLKNVGGVVEKIVENLDNVENPR
jgi:very-short-patch-repair endonuclease